jgi:imidazolonepropionase-like amidohydrolase
MRHFRSALVLVATVALTSARAMAQEKPVAFRGARIISIAGAPIENGVLVVAGGRITAVGAAGSVRIPADAQVVDVAGKVIMPGLVDTHSHVGGGAGADASAPMQGDVRILDAIDAQADNFKRARAGGITTVNVMPGSGHLMSGQTVYLKLRNARTIYDLMYCHDPLAEICGGMKMANGTNPRGSPPWPGTRAKAAAIVREKFIKAREYRAKVLAAGSDST